MILFLRKFLWFSYDIFLDINPNLLVKLNMSLPIMGLIGQGDYKGKLCRELTQNSQTCEKQNRENTRQRKINHTHKTVFT